MTFEQHSWWSAHLNQEITLRTYGHAGKPVLVFPSQEGRYYEYDDFGMVDACKPWLDAGKIRLITVDSVDSQSWCNQSLHPHDRAKVHQAYDDYITHEVIPFIHKETPGPLCVTGCSMGGYQSANYFFRHPDLCDSLIAISGIFQLHLFIGDFMDEAVYFHSPLAYLPSLQDPWYLDKYRHSQIFVGVGQGAWEDDMLADTRALQHILAEKKIPATIDIWGHDVNHDWPWWRKMMPYFLEKINLGAVSPAR